MILTSPISAASSTQITHFSGLIAPAAWGAPFQLPGPPGPPGPGQFPPPPLLVALFPLDGTLITDQGSPQHGTLVTLLVVMTDPVTHRPLLMFIGNSTTANFQVDPRLTTASLDATVNGIDLVSFSPKTITITVSWTATNPLTGTPSPIIRTTLDNRVQFGDFSLAMHLSSQMRLAIASGTLTVTGGSTIPLPPTPAAIARAELGTIAQTLP
jgi:hypothetical protein